MDFAFILDPLPLLKAYKDTSISMMRALAARGHALHVLGAVGRLLARRRHGGRGRPIELGRRSRLVRRGRPTSGLCATSRR
jgi:glutathione synthase